VRYVVANWKMYPTLGEARRLLAAIQDGLRDLQGAGPDLATPVPIICPPFPALVPLRALIDPRVVRLGAQNCHWERAGPYTGEVSVAMLEGIVDYVLLGHSERRAAGETDDDVARKVTTVADAGLVPVVFVGEDAPTGEGIAESEERLRHRLAHVDLAARTVLVVYEPVWSIGADHPADPEHVRAAVEHLKEAMGELGDAHPQVLYGGSVRRDNVGRFARLEVLDGVGATRGSLDAEEFLHIVGAVSTGGPEAS
jgi:triosephosphate isomerase